MSKTRRRKAGRSEQFVKLLQENNTNVEQLAVYQQLYNKVIKPSFKLACYGVL